MVTIAYLAKQKNCKAILCSQCPYDEDGGICRITSSKFRGPASDEFQKKIDADYLRLLMEKVGE